MFYAQKGSLLVELGEDDGVGVMSPNRRKENEEFLSFFVEGIVRVEYFLYLCGGFEIKVINLYIYYGYTCKNAGARAAKPKAHCAAGGR